MKTKRWITYTIYGILITLLFLYLRFPSDSASNYIRSTFLDDNPAVILSFDSATPCIPPGLRLSNVEISLANKPDAVFRTGTVTVRPALTKLLNGKVSLLMNTDAYGGEMRIGIHFANRFRVEGPVRINACFNNINLGKCSPFHAAAGRQIGGTLSGTFSYDGRSDRITGGTGSAHFSLVDGSIQLLKDIFSLSEMNFDTMEADLILKNRTLTLKSLEMTGKEFSGSFSGRIFVREEIMRSRLSLKGTIRIHAINRDISTSLNGTIANPVPRFM